MNHPDVHHLRHERMLPKSTTVKSWALASLVSGDAAEVNRSWANESSWAVGGETRNPGLVHLLQPVVVQPERRRR